MNYFTFARQPIYPVNSEPPQLSADVRNLLDKVAYSINELVTLAPLGRSAIFSRIREGVLPARKCGRRTMVLKSDFERFLESLPSVAVLRENFEEFFDPGRALALKNESLQKPARAPKRRKAGVRKPRPAAARKKRLRKSDVSTQPGNSKR